MKDNGVKLAIIGATGLVGRTMAKVLEDRESPIRQLFPVATDKSRGKSFPFHNAECKITGLKDQIWRQTDVALLSAGSDVAKGWIPRLIEAGITCIDNSSAFRQNENVPLVVPEVNADTISEQHKIIANPNCSTIQLVMALAPLHQAYRLKEVVVCTYQSASGAGNKGKSRLLAQQSGDMSGTDPFPHILADNLIPGIGELDDNGYFSEETKLICETRKILRLPGLDVFPTAVRVPVTHCHGESVHLFFDREVHPEEARSILQASPGITVIDEPGVDKYPLPSECVGDDNVFVGRIRQTPGQSHSLDVWIVTDNLRKGAATNAVQILEYLISKQYI
ncbi:aspartate-semialdehyde dehydrogenase [candidate division LCP-89 bacterium B3_LCP]|uniref:Aspartate-semialdehyde dehydrogenase n=1 Tax=candidate division LCP-89 bacterium B3_LCP TaxID=2012998 RepID=A0A532UPS5_UNCL8|nr:MAG: aspartate-semialdehyde dehydrogenase [candidate division LCP-89 bacterium B3_LCP]